MTYSVMITDKAKKQIDGFDKPTKLMIYKWMAKHLEGTDDPFVSGHALSGNLAGLWRYRIGDYRIIAKIEKNDLVILVVEAGHRSIIYG